MRCPSYIFVVNRSELAFLYCRSPRFEEDPVRTGLFRPDAEEYLLMGNVEILILMVPVEEKGCNCSFNAENDRIYQMTPS